jgi:hypothetical protein
MECSVLLLSTSAVVALAAANPPLGHCAGPMTCKLKGAGGQLKGLTRSRPQSSEWQPRLMSGRLLVAAEVHCLLLECHTCTPEAARLHAVCITLPSPAVPVRTLGKKTSGPKCGADFLADYPTCSGWGNSEPFAACAHVPESWIKTGKSFSDWQASALGTNRAFCCMQQCHDEGSTLPRVCLINPSPSPAVLRPAQQQGPCRAGHAPTISSGEQQWH